MSIRRQRKSRPMSRRTKGFVAAPALLLAGLISVADVTDPPSADAWVGLNCKWPSSTVKYKLQGAVPVEAQMGANDWNARAAFLRFSRDQTGPVVLNVYHAVYGGTGWSGATWWSCNASGNFNNPSTMAGNISYLAGYTGPQIQAVYAHEFGHVAGLDHNNTILSTCPGAGNDYQALMYYSDWRFYGNCPVLTPRADDINGANALYTK